MYLERTNSYFSDINSNHCLKIGRRQSCFQDGNGLQNGVLKTVQDERFSNNYSSLAWKSLEFCKNVTEYTIRSGNCLL